MLIIVLLWLPVVAFALLATYIYWCGAWRR